MALARPLLLVMLYVLAVGGQAPQVRGPADDQAVEPIAAAIGGLSLPLQETFDEELLLKPLADNHLLVSAPLPHFVRGTRRRAP